MRPSYRRLVLAGCAAWLLAAAGCRVRTYSAADVVIDEPTAQADKPAEAASPATKKAEAGPPFRLPDDPAGKLLGRVLPPAVATGPLPDPVHRPAPLPPPRSLQEPLPYLPSPDTLTRLPQPPRARPVRPDFVLEERPGGLEATAPLPHDPSFPVVPSARLTAADPALPPPLPVLGTPVPDRIPTDDVTTDVSTAAVLAAPQPHRSTPAPYTRLSVPRPFEHREPAAPVRLAEATAPPVASPRLPKEK